MFTDIAIIPLFPPLPLPILLSLSLSIAMANWTFSLSKLFEISRPQGRSFQTAQFRDTRVEFRANLGSLAERRGKWNLPKYRKMTAPCETSKDPFRNALRAHPNPDSNRSRLLVNEP